MNRFLQPFDVGYYTGMLIGTIAMAVLIKYGFWWMMAWMLIGVFISFGMRILSGGFDDA